MQIHMMRITFERLV